MNQEVLAVVAGEKITQSDFEDFLTTVPEQQKPYLSNPQFRQQCLDQLIALHMFAKKGEEDKLEETEEFQTILANAKRDILAQMAIRRVLKDLTVSEEEVKEIYENNKQQFTKGATVRAKHILTKEEDECNVALDAIISGEKTFEDAAKEVSTCPSKERGGDLGEFGRGQMVKEFEDAAFEAEIGHIVGPVKTQFGYHLIKVESKTEASVAAFEEVKETIRRNLIQSKQNAAYTEAVDQMKEKYLEK